MAEEILFKLQLNDPNRGMAAGSHCFQQTDGGRVKKKSVDVYNQLY